ncbi:hypothetical protein [Mesomycoplasma ovipneumoniae]
MAKIHFLANTNIKNTRKSGFLTSSLNLYYFKINLLQKKKKMLGQK